MMGHGIHVAGRKETIQNKTKKIHVIHILAGAEDRVECKPYMKDILYAAEYTVVLCWCAGGSSRMRDDTNNLLPTCLTRLVGKQQHRKDTILDRCSHEHGAFIILLIYITVHCAKN
jgi:hypothetical protein